ncbi:uncharacterized protein VP01_179g5 [Puccinia sorghi]|uniref:Uncharacterized protein n=1 Tax=Puccinia sorghi TaxID=27349 RepID=A0A0L6VED8_9BASI|nr:uncharacterized protein VP01_179g5 [Puccinia sorghi]
MRLTARDVDKVAETKVAEKMIDPWKLHRLLAEFNNRLPGEQELYILVRLYLTTAELAVLSRPPSWTRFTSKAILVSLVVLCFQCFYNLYLMISLGGFTLGKKTSLGMWNTETVNCNTLTTLAFVMLSLLDWSWKEYNTSRHRQEFTPNLLVHVTFIPVLLGTWYVPLLAPDLIISGHATVS